MLMLAGYLAFSWILFFFPTLIHVRRKHIKLPIIEEAIEGKKMLNIAHRGGPRSRT